MVELKPNGDGYKAVSDYLDEHFFNKVPKQFYPDWGPEPYIYLVNVECSNAGDCLAKMWYEMDYDTNTMTCHWEDDWWEGGDVKLWGIIPEEDVLDILRSGLGNVKPAGIETSIYIDEQIDIEARYGKCRK